MKAMASVQHVIESASKMPARKPSGAPLGGDGVFGFAHRVVDSFAAVPWQAAAGSTTCAHRRANLTTQRSKPLYTPQQRAKRDATRWTLVQGVLAPIQFVVFLASVFFVLRYLQTGEGYGIATASVIAKTAILYVIMVTGAIWEKVVFDKWLFAESFFWEDLFSMLVLALHTTYLLAVIMHFGTPHGLMLLALAAYATYVVNAAQFIWKLRMARLQGSLEGSNTAANHNQPRSGLQAMGAGR
jgi:3-vinyl bacteriochlorophyllide hydratase